MEHYSKVKVSHNWALGKNIFATSLVLFFKLIENLEKSNKEKKSRNGIAKNLKIWNLHLKPLFRNSVFGSSLSLPLLFAGHTRQKKFVIYSVMLHFSFFLGFWPSVMNSFLFPLEILFNIRSWDLVPPFLKSSCSRCLWLFASKNHISECIFFKF